MLSTSLIVPLEIAKFVFFALYVLATIGVLVGVYWEGDQFPKEKQQRGWRLLVRSLALDTLFTIFVFGTDGWIASVQRAEIIGLETRLAARSLSADQVAKMSAVLTLYGSMGFAVYPYRDDKESTDIADNIRSAFAGAGWENQEDPTVVSPAPGVIAGISVQVGIGAPENTKEAANALANMLDADNISATLKLMPAADLSRPFISVQVGIKP
jgi:hypothetical protein